MEKLFLRSFFIGKELNVIDQQRINGTVVAFKLFDRIVLQGFYHVLNEAFGVHIHYFGIGLTRHNAVAHRMQQVRFTETRAAIQEQRVVSATGVIGNRRAAARASWFDLPSTKLSNVCFTLTLER